MALATPPTARSPLRTRGGLPHRITTALATPPQPPTHHCARTAADSSSHAPSTAHSRLRTRGGLPYYITIALATHALRPAPLHHDGSSHAPSAAHSPLRTRGGPPYYITTALATPAQKPTPDCARAGARPITQATDSSSHAPSAALSLLSTGGSPPHHTLADSSSHAPDTPPQPPTPYCARAAARPTTRRLTALATPPPLPHSPLRTRGGSPHYTAADSSSHAPSAAPPAPSLLRTRGGPPRCTATDSSSHGPDHAPSAAHSLLRMRGCQPHYTAADRSSHAPQRCIKWKESSAISEVYKHKTERTIFIPEELRY
ncbi:predicted GPI-anchored protein 58 [Tachyglossus aculeatus]|uniref:predicted GPI-anchored protein 58 n=1 Tax=Tachyglossus aculeatus TaxID=9261 RepID=UPI0018F641A4|nr:predicted GPI-anchored protein 58 [Tachyglossus aculeatus]